jgi:RHS repeat-associated protein
LIGEEIDLSSGSLGFSNVDVSLPGNSSIEVAIRRKFISGSGNHWASYAFGNWQLDIPRIESSAIANFGDWASGKECSGNLNPHEAWWQGVMIDSWAYWNGVSLNVPGKTQDKVLNNWGNITSSVTYPLVTKSNWRIKCIDRKNSQNVKIGEGFVAQSPDGLTYTFKQPSSRENSPMDVSPMAPYYKTFMLVTEVKDRFGNTVTYKYDSAGKLTDIIGSDDRTITLTYQSMTYGTPVIRTVKANNRTWIYNYAGGYGERSLNKVTRPDAKQWVYNLSNFNRPFNQYQDLNTYCRTSDIDDAASKSGTVTHPNGVLGTFTIKATIQGRTNVPSFVSQDHVYSRCNISHSIQSKSLSGPGLASLNWQYQYSQNKGSYLNRPSGQTTPGTLSGDLPSKISPSGNYKSTTVVAPDASKTIHYFNRDFTSHFENKEFATDYYNVDEGTLLQRIERSFVVGTGVGYSDIDKENTYATRYQALLSQNKVTLYNTSGSGAKTYITDHSNFNLYGVPEKTFQHNSFNTSNKRFTKQGYKQDTTNWILNLPTTTYISDDDNYSSSELVSQQSYYSSTGTYKSSPNYQYRFGDWNKRIESYYTVGDNAGLPKRSRLNAANNPNRWSEASNYKRGTPQTIRTPFSTSTSSKYAYRTIDDNGWLTQLIDFEGNVTDYRYDGIGRLTLVNPQNAQWNNTTITYTTADGSEESSYVYDGMLIKTTTNGNYEKKEYFDGLLRPILIKERDKTISTSTRYTRASYNGYNKPVYQSQPASTVSTSYGNTTTYDGLGRVTKVVNNALGGSGVRYSYAPDSKVTVTDNRNLVTTTTYKAYGSPSSSMPISIITPSNLSNTTMVYNKFGNVTSISQGGITERRKYDAHQNLCKTVRPDIGNTAISIDAVGKVSWSAHGSSVSDDDTCEISAYSGDKTTFSYDNLGALRSIIYNDGTPTKTNTYDKNGNLTALSFDGTAHTYKYNDRNLLTEETLSVDGNSWSVTNHYNAQQLLNYITYPSGTNLTFSPDALGRPRNVGSFAHAISYHPTGQIKSMTQGNGCVNSITLKTYAVPDVQKTSCSGTYAVNNQYSYDSNLNLSYWNDLENDEYDLKFTYDALDRLDKIQKYVISSGTEPEMMAASTSSLAMRGTYIPDPTPYPGREPVGSWQTVGDIDYDGMGNITKFNFNGRNINYFYDSNKKLASTSGAVSYSMAYDERGNVTSNGSKSFSYNLANQMTYGDGNSYDYDGYDRRVKAIDSKGTRYSFYTSSGQLILERINGVDRENYYLGSQLIAYKQSNAVTYIHSDLMGSTAATTNSVGNIVSTNRYKPFGQDWGTEKNEIGYTGHKFDTDLGLSYMQARYYDPVIGRFYSNDPIGFTGEVDTFNRYSYVANNPYKYTDPTGMFKDCAEDPNCTVVKGGDNKKEEKSDESFDKALNTQINLARQTRDAYSKVEGSSYADTDVGGYIFEGVSMFSQGLQVEGFTLSIVNIRGADGLVSEPGFFGGDLNQIETGSVALVVAAKKSMSLQKIQDNSAHFNHLSNITKVPVYVISNGKTVYQYTQSK